MFSKRIINLKFQLDGATFEEGGDTVELKGLRCSANITHGGARLGSALDLRVWGMTMSQMNQLSVINKLAYRDLANNVVTVSAGDEDSGVSVAFVGNILEAWADASSPPGIMFHVSAVSGMYDGLKPVPPTSYRGTVDVALVMQGIAAQMNLSLENSGVSEVISDPYLPASLVDQLGRIAQAAHIEYFIDSASQTLAVWPKGKARGELVALISPETGLVGYPSFTQNGVQFTSIYNPSIIFGGSAEIRSDFPPANGVKVIADVSHNLDSDMPNGQWFTTAECSLIEAETTLR